ncbi:amino acid/amide ABC transporter ATP-binding protein 2 (HAAT family) [Mesorhizobium sp. J18]|uniref:ABC transporter ATP-binding protein n=1 Tax=Mesorhizobium sp. J18 TaxID=935263 RepID=UPI00119917C6|nr:ABC transporter ATP-binding protein [Mesorhizobium sp. J18]TWH01184.1 amino acid/amide ABC transporter ATP-binding protein 2 (HAAT family) [Mesorhizobium sp. J18]
MSRPEPILDIRDLTAGYNAIPVVQGISLAVGRGEAVALLGANGAGKSTVLRAVSGLIRPKGGEVLLNGENVAGTGAEALVRKGLSHVAEGRRIFRKLSVEDNLDLGLASVSLSRAEVQRRLEEQYSLFPILKQKASDAAGSLSGGQQQMLAISQALIRKPDVVMLDEPSTGLAPILIEEVFTKLDQIREQGVSILLVEQVVERSLEFVDYAYLIQGGRLIAQGSPAELQKSNAVKQAYMGEVSIR